MAPDPRMDEAAFNTIKDIVYRETVVRPFHDLLYRSTNGSALNWYRGRNMLKMPVDLWSYVELIHGDRPEVIVETGSWEGASAMWFADLQSMAGLPRDVISVDIKPIEPAHGCNFIEGSSTDPDIVERIHNMVGGRRCLVVLDSDHSTEHVLAELDAYYDLVAPGGHLVVEDTNTVGPDAALRMWLPQHGDFAPDLFFERWAYLTFHPGGWLRRMQESDFVIPLHAVDNDETTEENHPGES